MATNFYEVLGVKKSATIDEIKKAYKQLALQWHPDRNQQTDKKVATDKFKRISEAYSILSDPEKRKTYDTKGVKGFSSRFNKAEATTIFEEFMKNMKKNMGIDDEDDERNEGSDAGDAGDADDEMEEGGWFEGDGFSSFMGGDGTFTNTFTSDTTTSTSSLKVNVNGKDVDPSELKKMGIDLSDLGVIGGFDFGAYFGGKPGQPGKQGSHVTTTTYKNGKLVNSSTADASGNAPQPSTTTPTTTTTTPTTTTYVPSSSVPQKPSDTSVDYDLELTLDEFYNGVTKKLKINRSVYCDDCDATGSKRSVVVPKCGMCNGKGYQVVVKNLNDKLNRQPHECLTCKGLKIEIEDDDKCETCEGMRTVREEKILKIQIHPGTRAGTKITFEGLSDQVPGKKIGNINVYLYEVPHETFMRKGNDLVCRKTLTLQDALCGYEFNITLPDGTEKIIKSEPTEVVKPLSRKKIEGCGFPWPATPEERGSFIIEFDVCFPKTLSERRKRRIKPYLENTIPADKIYNW